MKREQDRHTEELKIRLTPDAYRKLRELAARRDAPIAVVVRSMLIDSLRSIDAMVLRGGKIGRSEESRGGAERYPDHDPAQPGRDGDA